MTSFSNNAGEVDNVWHDVKMANIDGPLSRAGMDGMQGLHGMDIAPHEFEGYNPHALELNHDNMVLFNQQQQGVTPNHIQGLGMAPPSAIQSGLSNGNMSYTPSHSGVPHEYSLKRDQYSMAPTTRLGQHSRSVPRSDEARSDDSSPLNRSYRTVASPISSSSTSENHFYTQTKDTLLQSAAAPKPNPNSTGAKPKVKRPAAEDPDAELLQRDDWDLTEEELQRKKKAQNRAAQRAFRERKETKLKDLEARLLQSEEEKQKLLDQLDMARQQNLSIQSENDVLRSRGAVSNSKFTFPESQQDFIESMMSGSKHIINPEYSKMTIYDNPDVPGAKLLAMTAVWDYIQLKAQQHDVEYQDVDVGEIIGQLRGNERCHGYGPAYPLELVDQVVENAMVEATAF